MTVLYLRNVKRLAESYTYCPEMQVDLGIVCTNFKLQSTNNIVTNIDQRFLAFLKQRFPVYVITFIN